MKNEKKTEYDSEPSVEAVYGQPESCKELLNKYGTYNIQPTSDSDNLFPAIAQGMPRKKSKKSHTDNKQ